MKMMGTMNFCFCWQSLSCRAVLLLSLINCRLPKMAKSLTSFCCNEVIFVQHISVPKLHRLSWWFCPSQGDDVMMVGVSLTWWLNQSLNMAQLLAHISTFGHIQFVKVFLLSSSSLAKHFIAITHIGRPSSLTQMITLCVQIVDGSLSIYAFLCSLTSCR